MSRETFDKYWDNMEPNDRMWAYITAMNAWMKRYDMNIRLELAEVYLEGVLIDDDEEQGYIDDGDEEGLKRYREKVEQYSHAKYVIECTVRDYEEDFPCKDEDDVITKIAEWVYRKVDCKEPTRMHELLDVFRVRTALYPEYEELLDVRFEDDDEEDDI